MAKDKNFIETKELTIHMGPQHPSAHGVLHLLLEVQGEKILSAEPDIGYLHRGTEKIAENLLYHQFVPYTDRLDYMCAMSNNLAYVSAVEKLLSIEIPERAKYIRVIAAELSRIAGHLIGVGAWAVDLGAMSVFLYSIREREMVLDIFETLCGARMTHSYLRVGGLRYDFTEDCVEQCRHLIGLLPERIDEYETILTGNRIWLDRNKGVGVISAEDAIALGLSGPALRGSGVNWDIRKDEPYLVYDRMDFDVVTGENGDCFDRYMVRIGEIRQSVRIVEQVLNDMPAGPFAVDMPELVPPEKPAVYKNMENLIHHFKYVSQGFKVPKGEVYAAIEAPKGELGVYIVSDGTEKPYRVKLRVPTFMNLQTMNHICKGGYMADVIASLSSLDPVFGECDK
ncbi:MAG: NADH dehydrogenase (quinone) subunit D [Thermodesulfobacteriota bacterium]|nr:MAG: NADH dehydrogenase (quinone) subunit D [Thermodesulfobacteriota bacterium]